MTDAPPPPPYWAVLNTSHVVQRIGLGQIDHFAELLTRLGAVEITEDQFNTIRHGGAFTLIDGVLAPA